MTTLNTQRGATGAAIFSGKTAAGQLVELFWIGARSGLFLLFGEQLVRIEHRSADGEYETLAEARKAAAAFIEAVSADECSTSFDMHWCDKHHAVRPEGFKQCAAVDRAAAELVEHHYCKECGDVLPEHGPDCALRWVE